MNLVRESYRPVGARGALLFFVLQDMAKLHAYYTHSLAAFLGVFVAALEATPASKDVAERVAALVGSATGTVFRYAVRGMLEKDKLLFAAHLTTRGRKSPRNHVCHWDSGQYLP